MARRRSSLPLVVAALIGLLLIVGVRMLVGGGAGSDDPPGAGPGAVGVDEPAPEGCTTVTVAASTEKSGLLAELAATYNGTSPQADGQCVWMSISPKASGTAAAALARGWDEQVDGPRPDVWTPAASSWAQLVAHESAQRDRPNPIPAGRPSLVQSPLVIAMPRPMAETLGWPDATIGWKDLAELAGDANGWAVKGHPEWGRFKLGKTNPHVATSGLNATIASYFAATGVSSDLTVAQVNAPKTREFVSKLENAMVHYGDTSLTFLANMLAEDAAGRSLSYVSAVAVEEKVVLDYNRGNPSGDPATLGDQPAPVVPLVAVYPSDGTLLSDNPWMILTADWVTPTKKQAATDFLAWLHEPDQQAHLTDAGFRDHEGRPGAVIEERSGLLPAGPSKIIDPPSPAVLAEIQDSWDELRKRAHVMFIMDVSGSMQDSVASAGVSKLRLAQDAAITALDHFAADDEVGLRQFSTSLGPKGEPWLELEPITMAKQAVPAMKQQIGAMFAEGGTALYATLRQAQHDMLSDLPPDRINAIVLLTDGKNEYPPDEDLDSLLEQLHGESVDTSVRVFPIGYGEGADPDTLRAIAEASRGAYYEATDPASIEKVLISVISNF